MGRSKSLRRCALALAGAVAVFGSGCAALPAAVPPAPADPGLNVENYNLHSGHPGMDCTTVMPDGSTGEIGIWVRSDSSEQVALAEYGVTVPTPWGQTLSLGTGEVTVLKVERFGPDPSDPLVGTFERYGSTSDASCRFAEPNFPYSGTVELAFEVGPSWPTHDELSVWCEANLPPELIGALCPFRVALP